jgi:formylglycine-generating enzyme required for sulfatase activity
MTRRRKKHRPDEIVAKLCDANAMLNDGKCNEDGSLSYWTARALAARECTQLDLHEARHVSRKAAQALATFSGDALLLDGLLSITDDAVTALAGFNGLLSLAGVESLSDTALVALSRHKGRLILSNLGCLSDDAAKAISRHSGPLSLWALEPISAAAMEALAPRFCDSEISVDASRVLEEGRLDLVVSLSHGKELRLDSIHHLPDSIAEVLATHVGPLSLVELVSLSAASAHSLSRHQGPLFLNSLASLSDDAARALSKHEGGVTLTGLQDVSEFATDLLRRHPDVALPDELQTPGHAVRRRVRELLESGRAESVIEGLNTLESLQLFDGQLEWIVTAKAQIAVTPLAKKWFADGINGVHHYRLFHRWFVKPRFLATWSEDSRPQLPLIDLVHIPAGDFMMGSPETEEARRLDEYLALVHITRSFQMGVTAVTEREWESVMGFSLGNDPCKPMVYVTWDQASLFCQMLTELAIEARLISDNQAYRLPTEAEWEYCCRAGTTTAYSFGDNPGGLQEHALCLDVLTARVGEAEETTGSYYFDFSSWEDCWAVAIDAAGEKEPNQWGLCDMHGNVLEWCMDWYTEQRSGGRDPSGPSDGVEKVCRGAYCSSSAIECRSATRSHAAPSRSEPYIGFRVVLAQRR